MPFKAGKSPSDVMLKVNKVLTVDLTKDIESALFSMYTVLAGTADYYAPLDTGATIKGRDYAIGPSPEGITLTYGYYDTNYAAFLHSPTAGSNLDGWRPRKPQDRKPQGGGFNSNARQGWMNLAWEEEGNNAMKLFASMINK